MKLLITLSIVLVIFSECKKNSDPQPTKYTGIWEARRENPIPNLIPPYRIDIDYTGPGNKIEFDDDSITISIHGIINRQGKFTIQKDTCVSCYSSPKNLDRIVYDYALSNTGQVSFLDLKGDTLTHFLFDIHQASGFMIKYVKIDE